MTGQELIDRCEERFRDTGNVIVSETEWLAHLNAAYRAFIRGSKWPALATETTATIAADGRTVALAAAAAQGGVIAVFLPNGTPLEPMPPNLGAKNIRHWSDRATTPLWYEIRGGRISVLPAWETGGDLTVSYLAAPSAIGLATEPVIPETYHDALVAGAVAMAYRDDGNMELAQQYDGEFDRFVGMATEHGNDKRDPQSPNLPAEPTTPRLSGM